MGSIKHKVKNILMSMRNPENEAQVNYLLGEIDRRADSDIERACASLDNNEEKIREFFSKKINENQNNKNNLKCPINDMFTYGVSDNCIHLHLPADLHDSISKNGLAKTMALVNAYLLDAIDRIKELKDNGFYKFQGKNSIYMISPAMIRSEMKFLESIGFATRLYSKKDLRDNKLIEENPEVRLATEIFGTDKNVGTASITFDVINSKEWQKKKKQKVEEFANKGITVSNKNSKNKE